MRAGHDVGDDLGLRRIRHRRLERRRRSSPSDRRAGSSCRSPSDRSRARSSRSGASAPPRPPPSARRRSRRAAGPAPAASPITSKYEPPTTPARTTRGSPRPTIVNSMVEKSPNARHRLRRAPAGRGSPAPRSWRCSLPMPRGALADVDQAILVAVDERPQQHAADDAEDGGVGADAERQRDDDGDRQALDPGQRSERVAEVGEEAHWWSPMVMTGSYSHLGILKQPRSAAGGT